MDLKKYKGIIFDLDGTLYSKQGLNKKIIFNNLFSLGYLSALQKAKEELAGNDYGSGEAFYSALFSTISKEKNKKIFKIKNWYNNKFYPSFVKVLRNHYKGRPNINKLMYLLQTKGFRCAIVSDFDYIPQRMAALGIDANPFRCMISCETVGALKPHPKGFLMAAEVMDLKPAEVLIVGDRADMDGVAAKSAGMDFIEITEQYLEKSGKYVWRDFYQMIFDHY